MIETNWTKFDISSIEDPNMFNAKTFQMDYLQEKGLSNRQLKELRTEWIKILPRLETVEYAYFGHQINQEFFNAICSMPNLKGLWIKWSKLDDFSIIRNLRNLKHLIFGGSVQIKTLSGLEKLSNLKNLELNKFYGINDLSELAGLIELESLELYGSNDGKRLNLEDISALTNLTNLHTLVLDIKSKGIDIKPIAGLKKLETLIIPKTYFKDKSKKDIIKLFPSLKKGPIDNE